MGRSSEVRGRPDPIAIASKGKQTSQIKTQESSDKPKIISTEEEL